MMWFILFPVTCTFSSVYLAGQSMVLLSQMYIFVCVVCSQFGSSGRFREPVARNRDHSVGQVAGFACLWPGTATIALAQVASFASLWPGTATIALRFRDTDGQRVLGRPVPLGSELRP